MKDRSGRKINYLRISVTDRCNLRCLYCMPEGELSVIPQKDILSYEEMLRVVKVAVKLGIRKVRVTGGEPLVRKRIDYFLKQLSTLEGLFEITMTTNGTLLGEFLDCLKWSGVSRVNVSLDSLDGDKYRFITGGGNLKDVLFGLYTAVTRGLFPLKVNVVMIRGFNDDEILDFVRFSNEVPCEIRFIELMPVCEIMNGYHEKFISIQEVMSVIKEHYNLELLPPTHDESSGPARRYRIKNQEGIVGFIGPMSDNFCENCNRIRLTADGYLRPCLFSDREVDVKRMLRSSSEDKEIAVAIEEAVRKKPQRGTQCHAQHQFSLPVGRPMCVIGG
ncbi:MAG: GTP 3',8-cyclase MoaA [Syntrophales bacterium]|nr:GTP 3',8-cyclase MoaA [Syntrophales bacterium]